MRWNLLEYDIEMASSREKIFNNASNTCINDLFFELIISYLKENCEILDIGTGNGYVLNEINKRSKYKINLYGNDISEVMLSQAKKINPCAKFEICSNYRLNFDSNRFDVVVAKNVTRFSAKEVYRVLKPGGIFIFREYGKGKGLVEVSRLFKKRLIRSRNKSFYDNKLKKANLSPLKSEYIYFNREFVGINHLIDTIKSYPFIKDFNDNDILKLKECFNERKISIKSDAILLVYKKEKLNE